MGEFQESGEESDPDSMDAYLEDLADRLVTCTQQGGDLGFVDGDSVSTALGALLGEQAVSPVGGSFDGAQMALHDAANACVCGGHVAEMEVSGLLDGGGLVEATTTIAELLVAEHCRCPDAHGYLQEALEELQRVLAGRQLVSQQPVGRE